MEPDSTLRTGKEWAGVWTRDVSYSIILAQATLQPRVAMNSLVAQGVARGPHRAGYGYGRGLPRVQRPGYLGGGGLGNLPGDRR
ncbi:MAG: hypothetical protein WKG07_46805 [Hymenobacter sp.]